MTSSELKELVKAHFSLVEKPEVIEEAFGELKDINGAFTIKFPGDSIQVGDKVTVVTAEGQEMDAPDGTHEMEDGTKIVTEGSVVKEIMGADGEKELAKEEMASEEEVAAVVEEVIEEVKEEMEEEEPAVSLEEVVTEIVDALKEEMGKMKTKMEELEVKVEAIEGLPAAEATIVTPVEASKAKFSSFNVETAANADVIKMAIAKFKNKRK
jgi:hypothetical protein